MAIFMNSDITIFFGNAPTDEGGGSKIKMKIII